MSSRLKRARKLNLEIDASSDDDAAASNQTSCSDSDTAEPSAEPLRRQSARQTSIRRNTDTARNNDDDEDDEHSNSNNDATEQFRQFLVKWSEEYHIRSDSLSALLAYFKANSFPTLPSDSSTLHRPTSSSGSGRSNHPATAVALRRVTTTMQQIGRVLVSMKRQQHADVTDVKRALLHSEQSNAARFDALMGQMRAMMEHRNGGGGNKVGRSSFGLMQPQHKIDDNFEEPHWPLQTSFEVNDLNERLLEPWYRQQVFVCMDAWQIFVRDSTRKTVKKYMEHMFTYDALFEYSWTGKTSIDTTLASKLQFEKMSQIIRLLIDVVRLPVNDVTMELKYFMKRVPQNARFHRISALDNVTATLDETPINNAA